MIPRDAEVIGHRSPLPRIEIGPTRWPEWPSYSERDEMWQLQRQVEATRIWQLIKEACA